MTNETVVIVADAHLRGGPGAETRAFHHFLERVPDLGTHLVVNGDLFDFWFEYRSVIPRRAFPTLAALLRLRVRGVRLTLTGGNHDRWGGAFWREELDADYHPNGATLPLAGWRAHVTHGDGLSESHGAARIMHRVTRWRLTAGLFRWVHPDLGMPLVQKMSGTLADHTRDPGVLGQVAERQAAYARRYLTDHPDVDLLIMSHTHRAALEEIEARRWYVNPGAWVDERRYAVLDRDGPRLQNAER